MSVTGYLALYTTLIGWQQYQNLWGLVVDTGSVKMATKNYRLFSSLTTKTAGIFYPV